MYKLIDRTISYVDNHDSIDRALGDLFIGVPWIISALQFAHVTGIFICVFSYDIAEFKKTPMSPNGCTGSSQSMLNSIVQ